jgi:hypothetical protein
LIDNLPYALVFRLRGGGPGNLYFVEQTEFHAVFPLSEVHNAYGDVSHRGTVGAAPLWGILDGAARDSNPYNSMEGPR